MSVPRGTASRLRLLSSLVLAEATRQNLIAASTLPAFFRRHIADSLQLASFLQSGTTIDIGTGAGFPGLALACVCQDHFILVEPRQLRAAFLVKCAEELGLFNVSVLQTRIERAAVPAAANITARAVMALPALFKAASRVTDPHTRWILPKGRSAQSELDEARRSWHGHFRLVASRTDPEARIVVADAVRRRED